MTQNADPPSIGMDRMEIRQLLRLAAGHPLRAAIALSPDGKAIIVLDRHKQPRALDRELKEQLPGGRLHRFGTFSADEDDRKMARFVLNRAAPGMARRLVKALKGTGLRRVEITLEDGTEDEAAEDVDTEQDVALYDAAQRRADAREQARHVELSQELRALAARIADLDRTRRAELVEAAEAVQAELKRNRLDRAEGGIANLREALDRCLKG